MFRLSNACAKNFSNPYSSAKSSSFIPKIASTAAQAGQSQYLTPEAFSSSPWAFTSLAFSSPKTFALLTYTSSIAFPIS